MKISRKRFAISILTMFVTFLVLALPFGAQVAMAQSDVSVAEINDDGSTTGDNLICKIFPFIQDISVTAGLCGGTNNSAATIANWIQFALSLVFIGIIIIAVVSIIKAAVEYIRSEGDEGKVQEASKSIKSVFIGIGALIVGLVGLAIVLTVLGVSDSLETPGTDGLGSDESGVIDEFLTNLSN